MRVPKQSVFIILGPTSSGKTSLALKLCKKLNGEIISADSRQVVRYMNIGTGKIPFPLPVMLNSFQHLPNGNPPPPKKLKGFGPLTTKTKSETSPYVFDEVSIWGYDLIDPNEYFSGYDYANFAINKLQQILEQGKTAFLVGGTGFYIDLVTNRIKPALIEPNPELRKELGEMSLIHLQDILRKLNLAKFEKIDKNNRVRLIRAIEIAKSHSSHHPELENCHSALAGSIPLPHLENVKFVYIGLTAPRETLYKNADNWLDSIWKNGLENEVSGLLKGPYSQSSKLKGLVYGETVAYLKKEISKKEAIQKSKFALHAYIKRQLTWFKKNTDITWFDITQDNFEQNIYNFVNG